MKCSSIPEKLTKFHKHPNVNGKITHSVLKELIISETKKVSHKAECETSLSHFAHKFSDELSLFYDILVSPIYEEPSQHTNSTLEDDEKADFRSNLNFLKKCTSKLQEMLNSPGTNPNEATSKDSLYMYFKILKFFGDLIAHKIYLSKDSENVFSEGISAFVSVFLYYGVAIVDVIYKAIMDHCQHKISVEVSQMMK